MASPCELLSRKQREATPLDFATYLVKKVRTFFGVNRVACLWVQEDTVYSQIDGCDCWPLSRDARKFAGPGPIIAHPPCGPWGKFRWNCRQSKADGILAMDFVHRFGGVVEQPVGSSLFRLYQEPMRGIIERVNQGRHGHRAPKATILYWVVRPVSLASE